MDPLRHVKPAVRAISAYTLAEREALVKIDQNENPRDLPEALKRRVLERALARPWSRYPAFDPKELLQALARVSGWCPEGILAGNGSNEMIAALLVVTVGSGTKVVIPEPTFTLYALLTTVLGGEPIRVPLSREADGRFVYDAERLRDARRQAEAPLTIICSPNNPTGTTLPSAEIERLCRQADGLVVIDEAYHEFAGRSVVPLLEQHPNLVVLRTFSKAMALAGLRIGYLLASAELVREVNKARLPYNVNVLSQMAAIAELEEPKLLANGVQLLVEERGRLLARLSDMPGVRALPSEANFFLLELLSASPKAVFDALVRRGVLVRDVTSYPQLAQCLRVSVGTPQENDVFLHALGTALAEAGQLATRGRA
jgi:histidinol-phosphate aminotransferase